MTLVQKQIQKMSKINVQKVNGHQIYPIPMNRKCRYTYSAFNE